MNKRIIPCLDIKNGRVVKGKKFENIQDVANPLTLAQQYELEQADALFLLDITGKDRDTFLSITKEIHEAITIPLYVGGGIRSLEDIEQTIASGATKIAVTSAAIQQPDFLEKAVNKLGGSKLVLSIDAKKMTDTSWHAFINGGTKDSGLDVIDWAKKGAEIGVGEILLNSIDTDGIKDGYDIDLNKKVAEAVTIPVIASGGAGDMDDFREILTKGKANAALAASVFHYDEINITDLKEYLLNFDVPVEEI